MAFPDSEPLVFANPISTDYTFCNPVTIRIEVQGTDVLRTQRLTLSGDIDFGPSPATMASFVLESGPTSSGPWTAMGYCGAPSFNGGRALSKLFAFEWFRTDAGMMPSISFEPDNRWFRLGVKMDQVGGSVNMLAHIAQQPR